MIASVPIPQNNIVQQSQTKQLSTAVRLFAAGLLGVLPSAAQNTWHGSAGTTNRSTPGNWSFALAPTTSDTVLLDNCKPAAGNGVIENIVDSTFTLSAE